MLRLATASWLAFSVAACAPPPAARWQAPAQTPAEPLPLSVPAPTQSEAAALADALIARPSETNAVIAERARTNLGPGASRSALRAEERRLRNIVEPELERRLTVLDERARRAEIAAHERRRSDYCRDLAHNIFVRTARTSDVIARSVTGYAPREQMLYDDCMASFARTDRLLAR